MRDLPNRWTMMMITGVTPLLLLACGGAPTPSAEDPPAPPPEPVVEAPPEPPAPPAPTSATPSLLPGRDGLADDDPLLAAVRKLAECDLTLYWSEIKEKCPHYGAYAEAKPGMRARGDDKSAIDVTFIRMLADERAEVRRAALYALDSSGISYRFDPEMAAIVVERAMAERDPHAAKRFASLIHGIKSDETGTFDAIKRIVEAHPLREMRLAVLGEILFFNQRQEVFDYVRSYTTHADPAFRKTAMTSFWVGTPKGLEAETCQILEAMLADQDRGIAGEAAAMMGGKDCLDRLEALLKHIAQHTTAGSARGDHGIALLRLARSKKTSSAHRQRIAVVARKLANSSNNEGSAKRFAGQALDELGK